MVDDQGRFQGNRFDADQPIERREQDVLGRRSFAEDIARDLSTVPADKGFTAAVVGEWGSGKTSVLYMVEETLRNESPETIVLRFNPWLFGGAHDLLVRFFSELSAQLGSNKTKHIRNLAAALLKLGEVSAPMTSVPGSSILGKLLGLVGKQINEPLSLFEQRNRFKEALKSAGWRIVVVIDDVDRLEAVETRELIRLVRLTSDLPNIVFLLAFDWKHVAQSLGSTGEDGSQYLDKIVQLKYNIPTLRKGRLHGVFFRSLDEVLKRHETTSLDRNVWWRVLNEVIDPLLENVRDVKRLLYALPATLSAVGREVALADLLGLEAIRVLRPELYEALRANARLLVHPVSFDGPPIADEVRKTELTKLTSGEYDSNEEMKKILEILFPSTQGFLGGMAYGPGWDATWRKERRVACEEVL